MFSFVLCYHVPKSVGSSQIDNAQLLSAILIMKGGAHMKHEIKLPESADKALGNLTNAPAKEIGQTIADLWFLVFGKISNVAEKRRVKYAHSLELLKKQLEIELKKVSDEKKIEPDTQIIMSALQDAQFCVENETLRDMFARLIASSIDSDTSSLVHPSFSGIIRQLSTRDAQNIMLFKENSTLPIVTMGINDFDGKELVRYRDLFIANPNTSDYERQAISIRFLRKVGLLDIHGTDSSSVRLWQYKPFEDLPEYKELVEQSRRIPPFDGISKVIFQKGSVTLTLFGRDFLAVCT